MKPTAISIHNIILVAAAYYLTGRLGLIFAIPPGYASPVWPPAGIGLAALLLLGWRCWPSIFLGSLLNNLTDDWQAGTEFMAWKTWLIPSVIAFGAAARALAGRWLIQKFISLPTSLEKPRDIVVLMLLGGPVSCLIGATIGCLTLLAAGIITPENFAFRWYAWWVGDIMGVIVFTPMLLLVFAKESIVSRYRKTIVGVALPFLFTLAVYAFWSISKHENDTERFRFERKAEQLTRQLEEKVHQQLSLLVAVKSFIGTSGDVTYDQFVRFTQPLLTDNMFITGVSWIPRVSGQERTTFERSMREQRLDGFVIRSQAADGTLKASPARDEYFPIAYTLPLGVQAKTQGFDIASESYRRRVINDVRDSGEARILTPITLLANDKEAGFIVYLPVYRKEAPTQEDRRIHLRGYVATGFTIPHILKPLMEDAQSEHIRFALFVSEAGTGDARLLFGSKALDHENASKSNSYADRIEKSFLFAGHHLSLVFAEDAGFVAQQKRWALWAALTGETLLMGLIGTLMLIMTARIDIVQRLVNEKTKELRISDERLQLVVNGTIDGIWDWPDSTKDEVYWSPQWKALLGYKDDEITGSKSTYYELLHPDDREACAAAVKECLEKGKTFDIEYRLKKKSGEYGWFHGKGIVSKNGEMTRMTGSITDISERKSAENIRDGLVTQLTTANEQLEQFAYVASHDLREPLRIVVSFSDLLIKEYDVSLNDEGRQYLAIMRKAAKKMEAMVADLLNYGRLGHDNERLNEIDCNKKLEQAKEALAESISSTRAVIESDHLPKVTANPLRFSRLLQNLIGNAIKYQRPGNPPVIHVGVENKKDHWQFAVKDNGIGIKPEYMDSIFAPFKRLHSDHEYAGTGMGLAICRRIVESFGGVIWVESEFGSGSTFFFTIPKRETGAKAQPEKAKVGETA